MKTKLDQTYTPEERQQALDWMRQVSKTFYALATQGKAHAFIEFTGLMNEFLQMCERAHAAGQDFTQANTHSGQALPMETYNAAYLAEKLNCIYGPALLNDASIREAFIAGLFEGRYKLVPVETRTHTGAGPRFQEAE